MIKTLYRWVGGLSVAARTGLGEAETGPCQVQLRPMPSLTDARAPRKPCPRGTASTIVIISQNSPSLVGKSEPPYTQDRVLACTRRTLSIRSNRGRRVLQVDDLHRTRERLGRSRYWSLASHSPAARPPALLIALLMKIFLQCFLPVGS